LISDTGSTFGVKVALAEALCAMTTMLGRDFTNQKILPLILTLLQDEHFEVKLEVVKGLPLIAEAIGAEILTPQLVTQL
jgi:hypothetical protein